MVPTEKCKTEIPIKNSSIFPLIKETQFPLTLAWACTVYKIEGLSLEQGITDFYLQMQKSFRPGQIHIYCISEF